MRASKGDVLRIAVAIAFLIGGALTWLADREARVSGTVLTSSYTGRLERRSGYRYGPDRAYLIIALTRSDGVKRTLTVEDASDHDSIPTVGDEVSVVWRPEQPDTLRLSEAVKNSVSQSLYWFFGIGVVMLIAIFLDARKKARAD